MSRTIEDAAERSEAFALKQTLPLESVRLIDIDPLAARRLANAQHIIIELEKYVKIGEEPRCWCRQDRSIAG